VYADSGNTGSIWVGFKGTNSGAASAGTELAAGNAAEFRHPGGRSFSLNEIYVAGETDGDRLTWNAWQ